jgi:hypothetical protein
MTSDRLARISLAISLAALVGVTTVVVQYREPVTPPPAPTNPQIYLPDTTGDILLSTDHTPIWWFGNIGCDDITVAPGAFDSDVLKFSPEAHYSLTAIKDDVQSIPSRLFVHGCLLSKAVVATPTVPDNKSPTHDNHRIQILPPAGSGEWQAYPSPHAGDLTLPLDTSHGHLINDMN